MKFYRMPLPTLEDSALDPKKGNRNCPLLQKYITRTSICALALKIFELHLRYCRQAGRIPIPTREFEWMYVAICRVGMADWLMWDVDGLYEEMTRHPFDMAYMHRLACSNLPPKEKPYYADFLISRP